MWSTARFMRCPTTCCRDLEPIVSVAQQSHDRGQQERRAGEEPQRVCWVDQSKRRQSLGGNGRRGSATHVAGVYFRTSPARVSSSCRIAAPDRRAAGSGGRSDRFHRRPGLELAAARARRKDPGVCRHRRAGLPSAPDSPTVAEAGLPSLDISVWYGLWAPKGTPMDIIAKLNAAAVQALSRPAVRQRFAELGLDMPPRERLTPGARRISKGRD